MRWGFFSDRYGRDPDDRSIRKGINYAVEELNDRTYQCIVGEDNDHDEILNRETGWRTQLKTLNGMCGTLLLFNLNYNMSERDLAYLKKLADWGNYSSIMATNLVGGNAEDELRKRGFKLLYSFTNKRTHNNVGIFLLPLT